MNDNSYTNFENENSAQVDQNESELDKVTMQLDLDESRESAARQLNSNMANNSGLQFDLLWISREFEDNFDINSFGNVPDVKPYTITLIVNHNNYEIKAKIFSKLSTKAEQFVEDGITEFSIKTNASSDTFKSFVAACSLQKFEITRKNVFELSVLAVFFEVTKLKKAVDEYIVNKNLSKDRRSEISITKLDNQIKNSENEPQETRQNIHQKMDINSLKEIEERKRIKKEKEDFLESEKKRREEITKRSNEFIQNWKYPIVLYEILENHSNIMIVIGEKKKINVAAIMNDSYFLISEFYLSFLEKEEKEVRQPFADLNSIKKYEDSEIVLFKVEKNENSELLHFYTNNYFIATYTFEQFKKLIEINSKISKLKLLKIFPPPNFVPKKAEERQIKSIIEQKTDKNLNSQNKNELKSDGSKFEEADNTDSDNEENETEYDFDEDEEEEKEKKSSSEEEDMESSSESQSESSDQEYSENSQTVENVQKNETKDMNKNDNQKNDDDNPNIEEEEEEEAEDDDDDDDD